MKCLKRKLGFRVIIDLMVIDILTTEDHIFQTWNKTNWIILKGLNSLQKYISLKHCEYFGFNFTVNWHLGINACPYWVFFNWNDSLTSFDDFSVYS